MIYGEALYKLEAGYPVLVQFFGEEPCDLCGPPQIFPKPESDTRSGKVFADGIFVQLVSPLNEPISLLPVAWMP